LFLGPPLGAGTVLALSCITIIAVSAAQPPCPSAGASCWRWEHERRLDVLLRLQFQQCSMRRGRNVMKTLISTLAVALALAFTGPAFAGDVTKATDKASCDKAGGTWDDTAKTCSEKKM
jgi:hypothetical protein